MKFAATAAATTTTATTTATTTPMTTINNSGACGRFVKCLFGENFVVLRG